MLKSLSNNSLAKALKRTEKWGKKKQFLLRDNNFIFFLFLRQWLPGLYFTARIIIDESWNICRWFMNEWHWIRLRDTHEVDLMCFMYVAAWVLLGTEYFMQSWVITEWDIRRIFRSFDCWSGNGIGSLHIIKGNSILLFVWITLHPVVWDGICWSIELTWIWSSICFFYRKVPRCSLQLL